MAEGQSPLSDLSGNAFVWVVLATALAVFTHQQGSLETPRPASTQSTLHVDRGEQTIDARLWQDPFAAVSGSTSTSASPMCLPSRMM
jgi:hypothetical protein